MDHARRVFDLNNFNLLETCDALDYNGLEIGVHAVRAPM